MRFVKDLRVLKHDNWAKCEKCGLHQNRKQVVLWRGYLPADLLLIGEAPGVSENIFGLPFYGPAGHLLDEIISEAEAEVGRDLVYCLTNLVACIPLDEHNAPREPSAQEIKTCEPRLHELIDYCRPKLIICIGKLAEEHVILPPKWATVPRTTMIHPSAILRLPRHQQTPPYRKAISAIVNGVERYL
jgi:DNA polymerase